MDMTNFTFSDCEESLQSQSLKDNIRQISQRLVLNSTSSQSSMMACAFPYSSSNLIIKHDNAQADQPGQLTPSFPWDASFDRVPAPSSAHTSCASLVSRSECQNLIEDLSAQDKPFDLTTNSALDLRVIPAPLNMKIEQQTEQDQPLALVKPKGETSLSEIPTQTDSFSTTKKELTTCTALDETIFYPCPYTPLIKEECASESITTTQTSMSSSIQSKPINLKTTTGLETIKQSYTPSSPGDASDKTSITVLIDDAFHYLEDIPEDTNQTVLVDNLDNRPDSKHPLPTNQSTASKKCHDLNQTYAVVCKPTLTKKAPTGFVDKRRMENKAVCVNEATPEPTHGEKLKKTVVSVVQCSGSTEDSLLDSSSFTTVTSLESDATKSIWSVKPASDVSSNLTLTLTKSTSSLSTLSFAPDSSKSIQDILEMPRDDLCSTPKSRIVLGSSNAMEESTIVKEASELTSDTQHTMFVSYPSTPDVSLCMSSHKTSHKGCNTEAVLSSTPHVRKDPIGNERSPPVKQKEDSLRTKLMKRSASIKPSTDSDSVLNIGFSNDNKKSTPVKRKKKSLLKVLKKQLLCTNASNVSQLSQHDQTTTATCLGRIIKSQKSKKHSCSPRLFGKCNDKANSSGATISFHTLNRSTYSTPLPAWCKQIIATTEATSSTPKPISTPIEASTNPARVNKSTKTSHSKSVGISTSSMPNHLDHEASVQCHLQRSNPLFDSVGISWLSQIDSYHTPDKSITKSVSTSTQDSTLSSSVHRSRSNSYRHVFMDRLPNYSRPQASRWDISQPIVQSPPVTSSKASRSKSSRSSSSKLVTSNPDESGKASRESRSQEYSLNMSRSFPLIMDSQQNMKNWMVLSSESSQIQMIEQVSTLTAEWLTTFMMDRTMHRFQSHFYIQPNKNVLLELCRMCSIKVKGSSADPDLLVLTKTSSSRSPSDSDIKRIIRGTRR